MHLACTDCLLLEDPCSISWSSAKCDHHGYLMHLSTADFPHYGLPCLLCELRCMSDSSMGRTVMQYVWARTTSHKAWCCFLQEQYLQWSPMVLRRRVDSDQVVQCCWAIMVQYCRAYAWTHQSNDPQPLGDRCTEPGTQLLSALHRLQTFQARTGAV